jgi:hypothetical protein
MADIHEWHINIRFCFKPAKTFTETHETMKNVYGDQCMSLTHCYECFKPFKDGQQLTNDELHLGQPSTSCDVAYVAQIHETMCSNRRLTVQEIAEECNILIGSSYDIRTTKLEICRVVSKFVPQKLTQDQRGSRVSICLELLDHASEDRNFLKRIITGDELWVYGCYVETKMQSSQWVGKDSPRSNVKVMLTVFLFDIEGVVHHEFLRWGQAVNHWYYLEVLKCLRENVRRKRL